MAFFNFAAFSILCKNCGKICDFFIFTANIVEYRYLHRFDVRGKICGVKQKKKNKNNLGNVKKNVEN